MFDLNLRDILLSVPAILIALTFHEFSHGLAAYKLGDSTAKVDGRLSLNPLRHIDPIGLLVLLVAKVGWAKPVMVDPRYLKNPKRDMAVISFSGPLANFVLAVVSLLILYPVTVIVYDVGHQTAAVYLQEFMLNLIVINIGLGVFNLIPLPPLDGSKVFASFLPDNLYRKFMSLNHTIMMFVVLALAYTGWLSKIISPVVMAILSALLLMVSKVYFFL